ncbi:hypothetical protein [Kitasatospora sp. NPDC094015]|uniref:hypothetical protein n=1 Tax=Kitasatospora sp. NPDC094015 TaxID=3155205 RepID=UPI00331A6F6F
MIPVQPPPTGTEPAHPRPSGAPQEGADAPPEPMVDLRIGGARLVLHLPATLHRLAAGAAVGGAGVLLGHLLRR